MSKVSRPQINLGLEKITKSVSEFEIQRSKFAKTIQIRNGINSKNPLRTLARDITTNNIELNFRSAH